MLSVIPSYDFASMPHADILVVPGGYGTRRERLRPRDARLHPRQGGSGRAGAVRLQRRPLAGQGRFACRAACDHAPRRAGRTGHRRALLRRAAQCALVDNGKVILSAGISMGIEASLHIVARQHGAAVADATAAYMEYDWNVRQVADHRLAV
ncbi:hypothetical protein LP420_06155 [Massilia sp. B-10]|nr:hypothetical protein LP420_06155 [Massilia sp. B-10]